MRRKPIAERFWPKVDKTPGHGPWGTCWLWCGATAPHGYGKIGDGTKYGSPLNAHRVSWELANGPAAPGMNVCHRCDVRNCVNPDHLFLGSTQANARDMSAKGRTWNQKLSVMDAREIQFLHRHGMSILALSRNFRVATPAIARALKKDWVWA